MILPQMKEGTERTIEAFLSEKMRAAGAKGYVLGVSGGIDSAVVMRLCARAVGKENVLGLMMPTKDSLREDLADGTMLCEAEGVEHKTIDITGPVEAFEKAIGGRLDRIPLANIKARCRMITLYYFANAGGKLVAGTSNKSELLMGYFTKYGDGGADIEPLADLYKTEVRQLAKAIGVPRKILEKAPSAGLWKGQTDEGEMGITYDRLDAILLGMEHGLGTKEIAGRAETTEEEVLRIAQTIKSTAHKREMPPGVKIGH